MSNLVPFSFEAHDLRVELDSAGEPLFVAKDVLTALEYAESYKPSRAIEHVPEEWRGVQPIHTPGGTQQMAVLTEQGLYFFIARSDKPKAIPFQKWIAGEVLPSIRKTGSYAVAPQQPTQSLEDAIQKEVKHLRAIGLDLETAFAAATKRVADERGIEHRLLIQSDEVTGRNPGWGQLPIKGISEEEVNKIREESRHREMIWHPREIAERFNLYDRNGKADTRLVLRILEAAGQCRIIEPISQTIEVTSEGKDVCYTLPRPFSGGRQYGNATRWEVAYFARCYLKFIDKHSYEFVNFKTY